MTTDRDNNNQTMDNLNIVAARPKLFISYAHADDKLFTEKLYNSLSDSGFDVWWDDKSMPSRSLPLPQEIRDAIDQRERLILVIGPNAVTSEYVRAEWQYAFLTCKTINPVLRIGEYGQIPELANLYTPDFRPHNDYVDAFDRLLRVLNTPSRKLSPLRGDVPALPPNYLHRRADVEAIASKVLADTEKPIVISTPHKASVVHGMGGVGKSVLVSAFAHSCQARQSFEDGIIWLAIGKFPNILKAIQIIGDSFDDNRTHYRSPEAAESRLPQVLAKRNCLIVLDDVWKVKDIESFINAMGTETRSRLLITSRDVELANLIGAESHPVDVLSANEALTLLHQWSSLENLPSEAPEIAKQCGYLPLALAMIGAMVSDKPLDRWKNVLHKLKNADLAKIGRQFPNYTYPNLLATIQVSVDALDEEEPKAKARYIDFSVFAEDILIPEDILKTFWTRDGVSLDPHDSQDIIDKLVARSLLRRDVSGNLTIHDLHHDYVRKQSSNLQQLQNEFVDVYRKKCSDGWHNVPDDGYFYDHLIHHLCASSNYDEAEKLFLSQDWIRKHFGVNGSRYDGVVHDLEAVWVNHLHPMTLEQIETSQEFDPFSKCFRYALIRTSINSLAYSPSLVIAAIKHGIWQPALAIGIAERIPDVGPRTQLCAAVLNEIALSEEQQIKLHRLFFDAIANSPDYSVMVEGLKKIGPVLHEKFIDEALQLVQKIRFLAYRAEGLAALLSRFTDERRQFLLQDCIHQISTDRDAFDRGRAITHIAMYLSGNLLEQVIEIIKGLQSHHERSSAIGAVVLRLNEDQIRKVYQIAVDIQEGQERAEAISVLATVLPQDLITDAINTVQNSGEMYARIRALVTLSARLLPVERNQILDNAFQEIETSNNTVSQSEFPTRMLYDNLPDEYQIRAIKSSFKTGSDVVSGWHRDQAFGLVVFRLCARNDAESMEAMFDRSFYELLHMAIGSCATLANLIPYLPEYNKNITLQTITSIVGLPIDGKDEQEKRETKKDRVYSIAQILPHLPEDERKAAFSTALNLIFVPQQRDIFDTLDDLIPTLNSDELREVIGKLSEITDYSSRAAALIRIARQLSSSNQTKIIDKILYTYLPKMPTETEKAYAIVQLAPLLQGEHLRYCMDATAEFKDEGVRATALANIVLAAIDPPFDEIYEIARNLSNEDAHALVIEVLVEKLTPRQVDESLDFIVSLKNVSLKNVERKTKILASLAPKLTARQIIDSISQIQGDSEKLINIVIVTSFLSVMEPVDIEKFLEDAVTTITLTDPNTSQLGIAWAAASIARYLDQDSKDRVCNHALNAIATMPGNESFVPGGNPKTNAYKKLIPCLDGQTQMRALEEVKTIPHLPGFGGEGDNPVNEVLEEVAETLASEILPVALNLLQDVTEGTDGWNQTKALETIAERIPETSFPQYLEIAGKIPSTWMRARAIAALLERYTTPKKIINSVRATLLNHLIAAQGQSRNELLNSVDVRLYKNPYIAEKTLEEIVRHILEICDEWDWSMST